MILSRQTDYDPKSEVTGTGNKDDVILQVAGGYFKKLGANFYPELKWEVEKKKKIKQKKFGEKLFLSTLCLEIKPRVR